jgi:CBS domain containing-hemolysin-like protein
MLLFLLTLALLLIALVSGAAAVVRAAGRQWLREWVESQLGGGRTSKASVVRPSRLLTGAAAATALLLALAGVAIGGSIAQPLQLVLASVAFSFAVLFAGHSVPRAIGQALAPILERTVLPGLGLTTRLLQPAVRTAE